jgi:hypothetical protein
MITNFKNKLKISILHKKKHIKLKSKESLILLQTQSFFWIKKTKARLDAKPIATRLLYNKLYGKKK